MLQIFGQCPNIGTAINVKSSSCHYGLPELGDTNICLKDETNGCVQIGLRAHPSIVSMEILIPSDASKTLLLQAVLDAFYLASGQGERDRCGRGYLDHQRRDPASSCLSN